MDNPVLMPKVTLALVTLSKPLRSSSSWPVRLLFRIAVAGSSPPHRPRRGDHAGWSHVLEA